MVQQVMQGVINVGVAESRVARNSSDVLACYGLGSCVGVALYDPVAKVGALAHVMLPNSEGARKPYLVAKYADLAIPDMVERMEKEGASRPRIIAKIAGGAQMFTMAGMPAASDPAGRGTFLNIGMRNVSAVKSVLRKMRIRLKGEDTGGDFGRTFKLNLSNGSVSVSSIKHGERYL